MDYSIVPKMIRQKGMSFTDDVRADVFLCPPAAEIYFEPFEKPFLIIDTFAKKSLKEERLVPIKDLAELKKYGYTIIKISAQGRAWFNRQMAIYKLDSISNPTPRAKRMSFVPRMHRLQMDVPNQRIRLCGENAGYPHQPGKFGGHGPWCPVLKK